VKLSEVEVSFELYCLFHVYYWCVGQSLCKSKYNQGSTCLWVCCEIEWDQSSFLMNCQIPLVKWSQNWGSWIGKSCFTYQLSISY
jgi:hypothetical protein